MLKIASAGSIADGAVSMVQDHLASQALTMGAKPKLVLGNTATCLWMVTLKSHWSRFVLLTHGAVILKARLDIGSCRLLVKLHEGYCINVKPSFPGPNHAWKSEVWERVGLDD